MGLDPGSGVSTLVAKLRTAYDAKSTLVGSCALRLFRITTTGVMLSVFRAFIPAPPFRPLLSPPTAPPPPSPPLTSTLVGAWLTPCTVPPAVPPDSWLLGFTLSTLTLVIGLRTSRLRGSGSGAGLFEVGTNARLGTLSERVGGDLLGGRVAFRTGRSVVAFSNGRCIFSAVGNPIVLLVLLKSKIGSSEDRLGVAGGAVGNLSQLFSSSVTGIVCTSRRCLAFR